MEKIETLQDLKEWANKANCAMNQETVCYLQDKFAHSFEKTIKTLWLELQEKDTRRLVLFAVQKIMGPNESFWNLIKWTAEWEYQKQSNKYVAELEAREEDICKRSLGLFEARRKINRVISKLRTENKALKSRIGYYKAQWEAESKNRVLAEINLEPYCSKARMFDKILGIVKQFIPGED